MAEFEPRRAEPGQEFSYTTTERRRLADNDDLPAGATLAVEAGDPDADGNVELRRFAIREGVTRTIRANDQGIVKPKNAEDVAALDLFGLPVARKALEEQKAKE